MKKADRKFMNLSRKEYDVLMCIAKGLVDKEIGKKLGISKHTVHTHIRSILSKSSAKTRAHAVAMYYQQILYKKEVTG